MDIEEARVLTGRYSVPKTDIKKYSKNIAIAVSILVTLGSNFNIMLGLVFGGLSYMVSFLTFHYYRN